MRWNQAFNDSTKNWYDRNKKWKMAVKKNDAVNLVELVACTKFGVNRPKQTKVRPSARPPFANLITRIFVENLVKKVED